MLDAKQAVGPLLTRWEQILHLSDRHDFWPVDRQRAAFVDQHRGTQRQHVLDPVGCRPIRKADDEPVVGGERDDRCLVGATRTATLMADDRCVCPWLAGEGTLQPVRERPIESAQGVQQSRRLRQHRHENQSRERDDPAQDHTQHESVRRTIRPHTVTPPTRTVRVVVSSNTGSALHSSVSGLSDMGGYVAQPDPHRRRIPRIV